MMRSVGSGLDDCKPRAFEFPALTCGYCSCELINNKQCDLILLYFWTFRRLPSVRLRPYSKRLVRNRGGGETACRRSAVQPAGNFSRTVRHEVEGYSQLLSTPNYPSALDSVRTVLREFVMF